MTSNFKPPDTPSTIYVLVRNSTWVGRIYFLVIFLSVVLKGPSFGLNETLSPWGKLRGTSSRPTAKGEVEGDLVQAHTQWGN